MAASIPLLVGCGERGRGPAPVIRETDHTETIRVACVGNSITCGERIPNRAKHSYPAQLGKLLGERWEVRHFGVTGATLLRKGDKPCWRESSFHLAQRFQPRLFPDKIHPNAAGARKIAETIYTALTGRTATAPVDHEPASLSWIDASASL